MFVPTQHGPVIRSPAHRTIWFDNVPPAPPGHPHRTSATPTLTRPVQHPGRDTPQLPPCAIVACVTGADAVCSVNRSSQAASDLTPLPLPARPSDVVVVQPKSIRQTLTSTLVTQSKLVLSPVSSLLWASTEGAVLDGFEAEPRSTAVSQTPVSASTPAPAPAGSTNQNSLEIKRRYKRHARRDPNAPVKPRSAFVIFSSKLRNEASLKGKSFTELSVLVGKRWKILPQPIKQVSRGGLRVAECVCEADGCQRVLHCCRLCKRARARLKRRTRPTWRATSTRKTSERMRNIWYVRPCCRVRSFGVAVIDWSPHPLFPLPPAPPPVRASHSATFAASAVVPTSYYRAPGD